MRVLICELVPPNVLSSLHSVGQAGNNYCFNFINSAKVDITYGLVPVQVLEKKIFRDEHKIKYIQVRLFKQNKIFRVVNRLLESILILKEVRKHTPQTKYWFYNITKHNFFLFFILNNILRKSVYVVLADFNPTANPFSFDNLFLWLLKSANGVIALSPGAKKFKLNRLVVLAGIVPDKTVSFNKKIDKKTFLFSGSIRYHNGIELALKTFAELPEMRLIITGHGDDEIVKEYAEKYDNIDYLGFLSYKEYLKVLNQITFCLNLRTPHDAENDYNFPSKILEFFQYGKILVSTRKYEAIPEQYLHYSAYNINELKETIKKVASFSDEELNNSRIAAKEFVKSTFSYGAMKKKVLEIEKK